MESDEEEKRVIKRWIVMQSDEGEKRVIKRSAGDEEW